MRLDPGPGRLQGSSDPSELLLCMLEGISQPGIQGIFGARFSLVQARVGRQSFTGHPPDFNVLSFKSIRILGPI